MSDQPSVERLLFIGSKRLGRLALERAIDILGAHRLAAATVDDSADERSELSGFRSLCSDRGVELAVLAKPSELDAVVTRVQPTAALVLGWYWILPPSTVARVPRGIAGIHASLLPALRGNAPLVWARLLGLRETGVSLFFFDDGIDTGDVIDQRRFAIDPEDTIAELLQKADACAADLVANNLEGLLRGTASRSPQPTEGVSYVGLRRPVDGRIDWRCPAPQIINAIRAQTRPYPGAFTTNADGRMFRIWAASEFPHPFHGAPGRVAHRTTTGVVIGCGEGAIVVHEIDGDLALLRWGTELGANPLSRPGDGEP